MSKLMIAVPYEKQDPTGWWMSEKLDGFRAWWTGEDFVSREGNCFQCPDAIRGEMPECELDGELWAGRGNFQYVQSVVTKNFGTESEWGPITYMVIDNPNSTFTQFGLLEGRIMESDYVKVIPQQQCRGRSHLDDFFRSITLAEGEGVVLRAADSDYVAGITDTLLKLKPERFGRGVIVGKKLRDGSDTIMASLMLRWGNIVFSVGGGFSDAERLLTVPVGKAMDFQFQFLSDAGIPKCAQKVGRYGI
jgi:DNA ligase-1